MAVTASQLKNRRGRDGKRRQVPVAASKKLYANTLAFLDASGFLTDVKVDANTIFAGVMVKEVDNSGGSNGDLEAEVFTDGDFELPSSGLAQANLGAAMHATDNYTTTLTATANPKIGTLTRFVSASVGEVSIHGLGEATT